MSNDISASAAAGTAAAKTAAAAASSASSTASKRTQDLSDRFLKLLVTQMQNQDPLNPMDNSQVTSQIAQLNTVSGINDLNDTLSKITGQIDTTQRLQASALIGRSVLVPGDHVAVGKDGTATPFGVELDQPAAKVTLTISDDMGTVVHQSVMENVDAGTQSFSWDGRDGADAPVDPGSYKVNIQAVDADGEPVPTNPLSMGYVNGVIAGDDGPKLDLGPRGTVALDEVRQII